MTRPTEHITNESGRYRRISTRMWGDEKFCRLSRPKPNGQSLFIYLLTGPQVGIIPGLYSIGERALSEQLGWPLKAFRKAWRELETLGIVRADWQKRVVWLEKSVRYNAPTSPNVVKSWRVALAEIPECPLKTVASTQLAAFCEALGPSFSEAFRGIDAAPAPKPSGKPSAMPSPKPSLNQD